MPYESPYQSMVENEVLFQQQPWISRVPHQVHHALTPIADALTGAGAGLAAGVAAGKPGVGAILGTVAGGLHGVLSHNPTPAQRWAFNNPEKVHVLKARAAYDAAGGDNVYHGEGLKMAAAREGASAVLRRLGLEKSAISEAAVRTAVVKRVRDRGEGAYGLRDAKIFDLLDPHLVHSNMRPIDPTHPAIQRGEPRDSARQARRERLMSAAQHGMMYGHQEYNAARDERLGRNLEGVHAEGLMNELPGFQQHVEREAMLNSLPNMREANKGLPPEPMLRPQRTPEMFGNVTEGDLRLSRTRRQLRQEASEIKARMAQAKAEEAAAATAAHAHAPAPPHAPPHTPAAAAAPATPKSRLGRNLALGAGALGLAAAGVAAYKGLSRKPEEAKQQGKVAMLRALGF